MKVLWFEISEPGRYKEKDAIVNGWQDSLELIIRNNTDISLSIAFIGKGVHKNIDGVDYYPINPNMGFWDKLVDKITWTRLEKKIIPIALNLISKVEPDIIHVFGSEFCWGHIASFTKVPVVIHMQGSIPSYINAKYPPGYSTKDYLLFNLFKPLTFCRIIFERYKDRTWVNQELNNFKYVNYYMGRTHWDYSLVKLFKPSADYYYCSEALRPQIYHTSEKWMYRERKTIQLITVGCGTFWKGLDTIVKTASILKCYGFNFEWNVAGKMYLSAFVESKEQLSFHENNVKVLGFVEPDSLKDLLLHSDLYVHTAYIDNSPNAICEAQYLGVPIISTNVGGISSLVENNVDGILVPANDPYLMAYEIISMIKDRERLEKYSEASYKKARIRHDIDNISKDLLNCYNSVLKNENKS